MTPRLAVVVPAAPGLLPCAGLTDPFADVRDAALAALRDIDAGVALIGDHRVGASLLAQAGFAGVLLDDPDDADVLVVCADGSAMRTEKSPGFFDPRAADFDASIGKALAEGDSAGLARLDAAVAAELWARGVPALHELARRMPSPREATVAYEGAPFGVGYWVSTWRA